MDGMIEDVLRRVESGGHLSMDEMADAIGQIIEGQWSPDRIGRFLLAAKSNGETVEEVAGAALALRRHVTPIRSRHADLIDTCGTGGDGSRTFNISTAAALVAAAAGVPVAKHGNRGITSRSGSADVLAALGVNIEAQVDCVEECLDRLGICFCFAPLLHRAMRHVAEVRKRLGVPTLFNILGPLANPAGAAYQLLGVGRPELHRLMPAALARLGARRAIVVHGEDGLDEVTLGGTTHVAEAAAGKVRNYSWHPRDFGLPCNDREAMLVDGPEQSAAIIRAVLRRHVGPARDVVLLNAAAAIWTVGRCDSLVDCVALAAEAIDSGAAEELLVKLVEQTNR